MDLVELNGLDSSRHPWELARLEIVYKHILNVSKAHQKSSLKLLDVGSGDGYFIREICRRLPQAEAIAVDIEYTDRMLEQLQAANKDLQQRVRYLKDLAEVPVQDYDIVILLDVIEHVADVKGIFSHIFTRLSHDASFIVTVPAFQNLFCSHDVFLKHYRRYTTALLQQHLEQSNIKVIKKGYFFFSLLLPRLLQVIREKLAGDKTAHQNGIGKWSKGNTVTNLIKKVLVTDAGVSAKLGLPGLSVYAIGKSKVK